MRGEAEVGQVDALVGALALDQDVAGLDVAVDEAAGVGGVERRRDLGDHRGGVLGARAGPWHRAARAGRCRRSGPWSRTAGRPPRRRGGSATTFGWRIETAIRDSSPKRLAEALVGGELGRDHLQRDDVVERQVGRPVDDAHPAPAGEPLDPVSGEHRPGLKRISHGAILRGRQEPSQRSAYPALRAALRPTRRRRSTPRAARPCAGARPGRREPARRSGGRRRRRRAWRPARATSSSVPTSEVASTSSSGIAA